MESKLIVSASPHFHAPESTRSLMGNVIIALMPTVIASAIIFGWQTLLVTGVCVGACVFFEWGFCKMLRRPSPIGDLSAVVTGIILAMNLPSPDMSDPSTLGMSIFMAIVGALIAIVIVKQMFGGIGMNFANPALVGRIVLFVSFATAMNKWVFPNAAVDQLASATPLQVQTPASLSIFDLIMGIHGGCMGEVCILAIVLGFAYLVFTHTISPAIPVTYIGTVFVCYLLSGAGLRGSLIGILSGSLFFGAVFMATDYVTSPLTLKGKLVYGLCLGIITFGIRHFGSLTEGVSFSILFMNLWVQLINDKTRQIPYGYVKPVKVKKTAAPAADNSAKGGADK
jgi:electron transport complex protein RnfD